MRSISVPLALLTLTLAGSAGAALITTLTGDGADTFVSQASSTVNAGNATTLVVRGGASSNQRISYLRFDTTGYTSANILAPVLNLTSATVATADWTYSVWGLVDVSNGANTTADQTIGGGGWFEGNGTAGSGMIWSNAPARQGTNSDAIVTTSGTATGTPIGYATSLGSFTITNTTAANTAASFSSALMTSFVQANTNNNVTFILTLPDAITTNTSFHSSEGSTPAFQPTLSFVPEPSTGVLLMGGLSLLIRIRRRSAQ